MTPIRPNNCSQEIRTRACNAAVAERVLRDAAFVLQLTRRVRQQILHDTPTPAGEETATPPAENDPPFTAA